MKLATTIAGLTLAIGAVYSTPATAEVIYSHASQPAARCQGALPAFETAIRKRPLAVQNEGTAASFVTCGFETEIYQSLTGGPIAVDIYFTNNTQQDQTVTCTAVTGWAGGDNEYVAFSTTIPAVDPEEGDGNIFWEDADFEGGGMETSLIAISCNLPAGVGINDTYIVWATGAEPASN